MINMALIEISDFHTKFELSVKKYDASKRDDYATLSLGVHNVFLNYDVDIKYLKNYDVEQMLSFLKIDYIYDGCFYGSDFKFISHSSYKNEKSSYIDVIIYFPFGMEKWCGTIDYYNIKNLYNGIYDEMVSCTKSNALSDILKKEIGKYSNIKVLCAKASYNDPNLKQYTFLVDEIKEDVVWYVCGTRDEVYVSKFLYLRIDELSVPYEKMKKLEWE